LCRHRKLAARKLCRSYQLLLQQALPLLKLLLLAEQDRRLLLYLKQVLALLLSRLQLALRCFHSRSRLQGSHLQLSKGLSLATEPLLCCLAPLHSRRNFAGSIRGTQQQQLPLCLKVCRRLCSLYGRQQLVSGLLLLLHVVDCFRHTSF
jgi:hypothetical protein